MGVLSVKLGMVPIGVSFGKRIISKPAFSLKTPCFIILLRAC